MIELTPEKLREAADVIDEFLTTGPYSRAASMWPDTIAYHLRNKADLIEADNAVKAERDKAIDELVNGMYPTVFLSFRERAALLYDAGWRKRRSQP